MPRWISLVNRTEILKMKENKKGEYSYGIE